MNNHSDDIVKSSEVIGVSVRNSAGANLGKIEEIVLDKFTGQARYVVLSFGGLMGLGDKLYAFPWKSISYEPEEKCFILNVEEKQLKESEGFDKARWPNMAQWPTTIDQIYS